MRLLLILLSTVVLGALGVAHQPPVGPGAVSPPPSRMRPHIILVVADDLGVGEVSAYGASDVRTPALDRLAGEGTRFTRFYANSPVCSPSRAALLTGKHPPLVGVPGVIRTDPANSWGALRRDVTLLPQVLRPRGYRTAAVGKWHLGLDERDHPLERGFDSFKGFLGDMMDDYRTHRRHGINYMRDGRREIDPEGHATDLFTQWAVDVVEQHDTRVPLFLYLAYNAPHVPVQPTDASLAAVRARQPDLDEKRARLLALVEHMDAGIGRVLDALDRRGMLAGSLVIATSDNGGEVPAGATNNGLRGGKPVLYEGGIRIPGVVRLPGLTRPGSVVDGPAQLMDLAPTIAELVQAPLEAPDGLSLWPAIEGKPLAERDLFFSIREGPRLGGQAVYAMRRGAWVMLQMQPREAWQLYHLERDPRQTTDLGRQRDTPLSDMDAVARDFITRAEAVPFRR